MLNIHRYTSYHFGFSKSNTHALTSLAIVTEMTGDRQGTWTFLSFAAAGMSFMSGQARWHASNKSFCLHHLTITSKLDIVLEKLL